MNNLFLKLSPFTKICLFGFTSITFLNLSLGSLDILSLGYLIQILFIFSIVIGDSNFKLKYQSRLVYLNYSLLLKVALFFSLISILGAFSLFKGYGIEINSLLDPLLILQQRYSSFKENLGFSWMTIANSFAFPASILHGYLFRKKQMLIFPVLAFLPYFFQFLVFIGKGTLFIFICSFLGGYFACGGNPKVNNKKKSIFKPLKILKNNFLLILIMVLPTIALISVFITFSLIPGRNDALTSMFFYFKGPMLALNQLVKDYPPQLIDFNFCNFSNLKKVLGYLFEPLRLGCEVLDIDLSSVKTSIAKSGDEIIDFNAFSSTAYSLYSFGIIGMLIYGIFIGSFFKFSSLTFVNSFNKDPLLYGVSLTYALNYFFTDGLFFYSGVLVAILLSILLRLQKILIFARN